MKLLVLFFLLVGNVSAQSTLESVRKKVIAAAREFLAAFDKDNEPAGEGAA